MKAGVLLYIFQGITNLSDQYVMAKNLAMTASGHDSLDAWVELI